MTDESTNFGLRYVGARFKNARMPIDVLSDLPAFRDLLVAFAKERWKEINTDRKRLPKGFDKSISFDLLRIEDGSAIPILNWNRDVAQSNLPGISDHLEEIVDYSYGKVVDLFDGVSGGNFPRYLPSEHIRALNKLGSGLKEDERIEFQGSTGQDGNVVFLDAYRRKSLITHVKETYEKRIESVGRLVANNSSGTITVRTDEYGDIEIEVDPETVIEDFDGNLNADVQFDILIELDSENKYRGIIQVFDVAVIDNNLEKGISQCYARLKEISAFGDGWNDGEGSAISVSAVEAARCFLSKRPAFCGGYRIYPTENSGIQIEFESNGWDFTIEFNIDGNVEMYGVEIIGDGEMEPTEFPDVGKDFMAEFDRRVKG